MNKKIAVIIPCYNEEATICKVISDFRYVLPCAEIYVYDNNSSDNTVVLAAQAGATVRYEPKQGKGNVIRTAFREIEADCYLLVDGDDTYPAEHAVSMCADIFERNIDMVVGDRLSATYFTENKRMFHNFGNKLVRSSVNFFFKGRVHDIMSGYRAFSPLFIKSFPLLSKGFEIETEMTIHALDKNFNIAELPVEYRDRPLGSESKLNTFTDGLKVLFTIFRLYKDYRPLPFFSFIAFLFAFYSTSIFGPILYEFFSKGATPHFVLLILSGFVMLAGMLSLSCGLILDTETKKARQDFEVRLNIIKLLISNAETKRYERL